MDLPAYKNLFYYPKKRSRKKPKKTPEAPEIAETEEIAGLEEADAGHEETVEAEKADGSDDEQADKSSQ